MVSGWLAEGVGLCLLLLSRHAGARSRRVASAKLVTCSEGVFFVPLHAKSHAGTHADSLTGVCVSRHVDRQ